MSYLGTFTEIFHRNFTNFINLQKNEDGKLQNLKNNAILNKPEQEGD